MPPAHTFRAGVRCPLHHPSGEPSLVWQDQRWLRAPWSWTLPKVVQGELELVQRLADHLDGQRPAAEVVRRRDQLWRRLGPPWRRMAAWQVARWWQDPAVQQAVVQRLIPGVSTAHAGGRPPTRLACWLERQRMLARLIEALGGVAWGAAPPLPSRQAARRLRLARRARDHDHAAAQSLANDAARKLAKLARVSEHTFQQVLLQPWPTEAWQCAYLLGLCRLQWELDTSKPQHLQAPPTQWLWKLMLQ